MDTLDYSIMKFNKASELLRDFLNQKEIISLFEKEKKGTLQESEQKTYDEIMKDITENKRQEKKLNESIKIASQVKRDTPCFLDEEVDNYDVLEDN